MRFAIYDLDGTLASIDERVHMMHATRPNHDEFNRRGADAKPIPATVSVLRSLMEDGVYTVIATGRSDTFREATVAWLRQHDVPYHLLLMRPATEHCSDLKLKCQWFSAYDPADVLFIMEDRDHLVRMWRELGFTVFQSCAGAY